MAKKSNPTRKILMALGGLIGLLILGAILVNVLGGGRESGVRVETTHAAVRAITQKVTASGKIQPEVEVKISPDVSGEITFLGVREGDWVEKGTLLARIRPDFYAAQVEQAQAGVLQSQANLKQSEANLLKAKQDLDRVRSLVERNAVPRADLDAAESQYAIAQASFDASRYQVESAEARLREARENLGKTSIYAPMSGTVSQLNIELGERVVGTSQMAGTEMMRLARLDQMEVEVDINENDVVNIALGDTAAIEVDAYPDRRFAGIVTEIANSARVTGAGSQEQVTNFPVKIRILDPHNADAVQGGAQVLQDSESPVAVNVPRFRPGMSGTVDIFTETIPNAVVIPIQAVTVRNLNEFEKADDGTWKPRTSSGPDSTRTPAEAKENLVRVVFLVKDGVAQMVQVETGIADDTHIEIRSGLGGEERVVTGPYRAVSRELRPGMPLSGDGISSANRNGSRVASN